MSWVPSCRGAEEVSPGPIAGVQGTKAQNESGVWEFRRLRAQREGGVQGPEE